MADAVAVASMIHYGSLIRGSPGTRPFEEGNTEFLRTNGSYSSVEPVDLRTVKKNLTGWGISCRYDEEIP